MLPMLTLIYLSPSLQLPSQHPLYRPLSLYMANQQYIASGTAGYSMATSHPPPPLPSLFSDPGLLESENMHVIIYLDVYTTIPWLNVIDLTALLYSSKHIHFISKLTPIFFDLHRIQSMNRSNIVHKEANNTYMKIPTKITKCKVEELS